MGLHNSLGKYVGNDICYTINVLNSLELLIIREHACGGQADQSGAHLQQTEILIYNVFFLIA